MLYQDYLKVEKAITESINRISVSYTKRHGCIFPDDIQVNYDNAVKPLRDSLKVLRSEYIDSFHKRTAVEAEQAMLDGNF